MELYQQLGFNNNPFSTFSAEEENNFLDDVFVKPRFYKSLKSGIIDGNSHFIFGARGIGKTALIIQLKKSIENLGCFSIIIDDYNNIKIENNKKAFLIKIIEKIISDLCINLSRDPKKIKKLSISQKKKLTFIITEFFVSISKDEYEESVSRISGFKRNNFLKGLYNKLLNRPINFFISGVIHIAADAVTKSLGLPSISENEFYKNYLPEISLEKIKKTSDKGKLLNEDSLKKILEDLGTIITDMGYSNLVIFFDKIDEYTELDSNSNTIVNFIKDILKDTTILMNQNYSLVFSIWDILKNDLESEGVRFDKIKPININWRKKDLENIADKRVRYFSNNKTNFKTIIPLGKSQNSILKLSGFSPRYLFRQLSIIYDQENEKNFDTKKFNTNCFHHASIHDGQLVFAKSFDYYSLCPKKKGSGKDIIKNINKLLKIGKQEVKTKDYQNIFKIGPSAASNHLQAAYKQNLIKENEKMDGGAKVYEIIDPVLSFLIKNSVKEL